MAGPMLIDIPLHDSFLERVVQLWLRQAEEKNDDGPTDLYPSADGLLIVPTRRSARALIEAFLHHFKGQAALLPRIVAVGALDEEEGALMGEDPFWVPPAVSLQHRFIVLSELVIKIQPFLAAAIGVESKTSLHHAWQMARSLVGLMDEAELNGCDLAEKLPLAAEGDFAQHWQVILRFLEIIICQWPAWLQEQGLSNPVKRRVSLIQEQAKFWQKKTPTLSVWAIGFGEAYPAIMAMLSAILQLPHGRVITRGVDFSLSEEVWNKLPDTHPQSGFKRILQALGRSRKAITPIKTFFPTFSENEMLKGRSRLLSKIMLPDTALAEWGEIQEGLNYSGITELHAQSLQEEAASIALALRHGLEKPGHRVALVTPDRSLAQRVVVELRRWGILADDSAGVPLAATPTGVFLRLMLQLVTEPFSSLTLLAFLKHPLVAMGYSPAECRCLARLLERKMLRGVAGFSGVEALIFRLEAQLAQRKNTSPVRDKPIRDKTVRDKPARDHLTNLPSEQNSSIANFDEREDEALLTYLRKLQNIWAFFSSYQGKTLSEWVRCCVLLAEQCAETDEEPGAKRLWVSEEGEVMSAHLSDLLFYGHSLAMEDRQDLPAVLAASLEGGTVRYRRRFGSEESEKLHPRVFIWGLLESRLQNVDFMVLGGLNETIWPPQSDPGPWVSRPMRQKIGLALPEREIGLSAYDFVAALCSAEQVILSSSARRSGSPAVKSRWLVRLEAFMMGQQRMLTFTASQAQRVGMASALRWRRQLDQPVEVKPAPKPYPLPELSLRPKVLSISDIGVWIKNPYIIYAKHVLGLRELPGLEGGIETKEFGNIVHEGLHHFFEHQNKEVSLVGSEEKLLAYFLSAFEHLRLRPAIGAWWQPRLKNIARTVIHILHQNWQNEGPLLLKSEQSGAITLPTSAGHFKVKGRADHIEYLPGGKVRIIDYKTGEVPTATSVREGWSPQLLLEAIIVQKGGFGHPWEGGGISLAYWSLKGSHREDRVVSVLSDSLSEKEEAYISGFYEELCGLIERFNNPLQPYLVKPRALKGKEETRWEAAYDQLARVKEWREEDNTDES
ncbi:double-strand break repair protein AddB [Entomobacter blattae]|uniref:PD-(D/E)XK nuclease superfamily protein n=1 Tax=Entomobacter blattae TaxID=2762277 RepID=A0A7H1NPY9_9PROT|nr:double-strand break repair protein AddB [Entomobacter blattae]QNT77849.1 PD-(D/E)XK nuclease superfamily protein [Entomobacter blattae]